MENWKGKNVVRLLVVLVAAAGVFCAQDFSAPVSFALLSNDTGLFEVGTLQTTSSADWQLENSGRQITDPARTPSPFQETHTRNTTMLPAVPAAISMTLCGFLCISFVRDRRGWLAMETGILWLGQKGIQAFPELTHRICSRITTSANSPTGLDKPDIVFASHKTITGNAQSIRFVGPLRKLEGIPDHNHGSILLDLSFPRKRRSRNNIQRTLIVCPVRASGHFIVFSPAFIFQNLSRGPPEIKMRVFTTKVQRAASRNVL